jgi:hypothetical protein
MSYEETITAIKSICAKINLSYSKEGDGRLTSALKETEYLHALKTGLLENNPTYEIEIPKERYWYDVLINNIPINLKLTTGGTDNAFNKTAIVFTISGQILEKRNMNFNQWYYIVKSCPKKEKRDHKTEYHYLVVNKDSGKVMLKSILDIHTYKSNPCNDLQINWANEFKHIDHYTPDALFTEKIKELLTTVQTSVKQAISGMNEFASATL